jgi:alpha-tubulin suppressor-like RCC1 family protein
MKDDGEVYMWGYSAFTQCANAIDQKIPTLVPEVGRIQGKIKSLGGWHSLLLTRQGVYGWGHNDDGRCGVPTLPYQKHLTSPTLVQFPELFIDVVGAAYHTLALTVSGKVVAWGTDYYLTIGNSKTRQDVFSPVYVEFFKSMIVERIFSSSDAQANMVISNGSVFAWGSNRGSVFALGDGNILPRKIEGLNGFEIGNINLAELNYLFTQD